MDLDVRTILVLFSILSVMFSGLIMFAGLNTKLLRIAKQWAFASLCVGLGLGLCFFFKTANESARFAIVLGCTLLGASVVLQFNGIRLFYVQNPHIWPGILFVGLVAALSVWFVFVQPNVTYRSIVNSILFATGYAACSFMLFRHIKPALKSVTCFTGMVFAAMSVVLLARAAFIYVSPSAYTLYSNVPANPNTFLLTCLLQICITFGFLLMLNRELVSEIEHVAARDNLTGAFNRRELESELLRLQSRCERSGDHFSLMLIDIDNFKLINDNFGHLVGDEILRRFARVVFASIRTEDYFARYGGDEFCVVLPYTSMDDALALAERLRLAYASTPHAIHDELIQSSISIGVSESSSAGMDYHAMVASADKALYRAKNSGRNRVTVMM